MLVSVIIPTYNRSKYIADAIQSVLNQTYKDIELIVIDDGSTDNTKNVLQLYIEKKVVKYIYQKNAGPAAARNRGIKASRGELIAFLDSDDLWLTDKLEKQVAIMKKHHKAGLVYTNSKYVDANGVRILYRFPTSLELPCGKIFKEIILGEAPLGTSSILVRKECFEEVGLYREDLFWGEDREMHARISMKYDILGINEILCIVRRHSENISNNFSLKEPSAKRMIEGIFDNPLIKKHELYLRPIVHARYRAIFANMCLQKKSYKHALKLVLESFYYNLFEARSYQILLKISVALISGLLTEGLTSEVSVQRRK